MNPNLKKFLLSRLDSRLQILTDDSTGKLFIASDFNRIGQSFRSPWSNQYLPNPEEADELYFPPDDLRRVEMTLNELLLSYCNLYFDNAVGSAFLSESPESEKMFYGVFQIKKDFHDCNESHAWESSHSFKVSTKSDDDNLHVECVMTSSVLVVFDFTDEHLPANLNGSTMKSSSRSFSVLNSERSSFEEVLVRNLGELMEENENTLRGTIDKVCIPRCTELAMASLGIDADECFTDSDSDMVEDDFRPRMSLGSMNPLHRQSVRPAPAFQADLVGAIMQRRLRDATGS